MGLQLIICVETNRKTNSDYIYIKSVIERFFEIGSSYYKLSPVYMDGKGKYASNRVLKDINRLQKKYNAASDRNDSVVLYCFDTDDYDFNREDAIFLEKARNFCDQAGYKFVWFCKDVEHVFLGKRISDNQKKREAERFLAQNRIERIRVDSLQSKAFQIGRSNLCDILELFLQYRDK